MPILVIVQEVCSTGQVPQIQKQQPRLPYLGPDDATPDRLVLASRELQSVQSRCYESLYYAPCSICCDITADRIQPVEMEVASFAQCRHCLSMVKCWSICTPRFLTHSTGEIVLSPIDISQRPCLFRWYCDM